MEALIPLFIQAALAAWAVAHWHGVAGTVVTFGVRIFRAVPGGEAAWKKLSLFKRRGIVFASTTIGAAIVTMGTGVVWSAAIPGAIGVGMGAIGLHKFTKLLGAKVHKPDPGMPLARSTALRAILLPIPREHRNSKVID